VTILDNPYRETDEYGNWMGCLDPLYYFYPNVPKHKRPRTKAMSFLREKLEEHFTKIDKCDIMPIDVILCLMGSRTLHIGIYLGDDLVMEVSKGRIVEINQFDIEDKRIIGVYRYG